jgi:hypothetical protein
MPPPLAFKAALSALKEAASRRVTLRRDGASGSALLDARPTAPAGVETQRARWRWVEMDPEYFTYISY